MLSSGSAAAAAAFRGVVGELATIVEWDEGPCVLYIVGKKRKPPPRWLVIPPHGSCNGRKGSSKIPRKIKILAPVCSASLSSPRIALFPHPPSNTSCKSGAVVFFLFLEFKAPIRVSEPHSLVQPANHHREVTFSFVTDDSVSISHSSRVARSLVVCVGRGWRNRRNGEGLRFPLARKNTVARRGLNINGPD